MLMRFGQIDPNPTCLVLSPTLIEKSPETVQAFLEIMARWRRVLEEQSGPRRQVIHEQYASSGYSNVTREMAESIVRRIKVEPDLTPAIADHIKAEAERMKAANLVRQVRTGQGPAAGPVAEGAVGVDCSQQRGNTHVARRSRSTLNPPRARPTRWWRSPATCATTRCRTGCQALREAAPARHHRRDDRGRDRGDVARNAENDAAAACAPTRHRPWSPAARKRARSFSMLRSSAARPRTASSSTTAIASARRIAAASVVPAVAPMAVGYERGISGAATDRGQSSAATRSPSASRAPARRTCASAASTRPARSARSARRWPSRKMQAASARSRSPTRSASRLRAAAGLFAFVNRRRATSKRLHAGHASREEHSGRAAGRAWRAKARPTWIEGRDGFMQAFAFGRADKARPIALPPSAPSSASRIATSSRMRAAATSSPPSRRLFGLMHRREDRRSRTSSTVDVETYIASPTEHAHRPWDDYRQRAALVPLSDGPCGALPRHQVRALQRQEPRRSGLRRVRQASLTVTAPPEIDGLYPKLRPARVTITTPKGRFVRQADEASGSRMVPLDDEGTDRQIPRPCRPGVRRAARQASVGTAVERRDARQRRAARRSAGEGLTPSAPRIADSKTWPLSGPSG